MTTIVTIVVSTAVVSLLGIASLEASVRDVTQGTAGQSAFGLITGLTGAPLLGAADSERRALSLGSTVAATDEVRTGQEDLLEILWDRRALILVHPQSRVLIHEAKEGQTEVSLSSGSVRVALAYNSGRPDDMVTVQTPTSRVFTRGGIVEVDVLPQSPSFFSRVTSVFSHSETSIGQTPLETIRVLEGQSGVESVSSPPGQSHMLEAGVQARIAAGMVEQAMELPQHSGKSVGLAETDRRQGTPGELTQRLVNVHITHALEVERLLTRATGEAIERPATATDSDFKGTIVATSLGAPFSLPAQPAPPPGVTSPLPPVQTPTGPGALTHRHVHKDTLPDGDKRSGKHKQRGKGPDRSPTVTSPLPTPLPNQASTGMTPVRGFSNRNFTIERHDDDERLGGKDTHKGRERDLDDVNRDRSTQITSPLPVLHTGNGSTSASSRLEGFNGRNVLKDVLDNDDTGKHKGRGSERDRDDVGRDLPPRVTSPLPTLPPVQTPTVVTLTPSQSGGINSRNILRDIFDDDKRGRNNRGRDRSSDRD